MSVAEGQTLLRRIQLEEVEGKPGLRSRALPANEAQLTPERVQRLAESADNPVMEAFIYHLYGVTPPKK